MLQASHSGAVAGRAEYRDEGAEAEAREAEAGKVEGATVGSATAETRRKSSGAAPARDPPQASPGTALGAEAEAHAEAEPEAGAAAVPTRWSHSHWPTCDESDGLLNTKDKSEKLALRLPAKVVSINFKYWTRSIRSQ